MRKFEVTVSDTATYVVEAKTANEAKSIAWDWFVDRKPNFEVKECESDDNKIK